MSLERPTNMSIDRATYQRALTDCNILRFYGREGLSHRRFISYLLTSLARSLDRAFLLRGLSASSMSIALFFVLSWWVEAVDESRLWLQWQLIKMNATKLLMLKIPSKKVIKMINTRNCCEIINDCDW